MRIKYTMYASIIAIAAALPAFAQDQTTAPPTAPQERERDVVVITANKREETVQDVAVAVTAVTADTKQQLGIITVTDLTNITPGLSYTPGNERVTLRGIGRLTNSFGADPGALGRPAGSDRRAYQLPGATRGAPGADRTRA